ncbi:MAG: ATP-dependent sacrificial sulfur transferase LarE [Candidatus Helarchaeota archaeon]
MTVQDSLIFDKLEVVKNIIKDKKIIVAFSGGVDSTLITYLANKYGKQACAVTIKTELIANEEVIDAKKISEYIEIEWVLIEKNILNNPIININPINRCYHCKKTIIGELFRLKELKNFDIVIDGTHLNDVEGYRPGVKALKESEVISPFLIAKISKKEIRFLSKKFGLFTWNKPSSPCLATRIPYYDKLTPDIINMVERAEQFIKRNFDVKIIRVRYQYPIARIEIGEQDLNRILDKEKLKIIYNYLKSLNFPFITLDLAGYQSGTFDSLSSFENEIQQNKVKIIEGD